MAEWDIVAENYDLLFNDRVEDLSFWVNLAKRFGSPVLEFACGTGRITFPIATEEIQITGIDISEKMLEKAEQKLTSESKDIQSRTQLLNADSNSFNIPNKKFTAIFSPWGFPPVTDKQQFDCLKSVKEHLLPHGYFVVDIRNAKEPTKDWSMYEVEEFKSFPDNGFTLVRQAYLKGSAKTKIGHIIFFLDKIDDDGTMKRFISERDQKIYTKTDMEDLLTQNGLKIVEIYGNYNFDPYNTDSERIIFISQVI